MSERAELAFRALLLYVDDFGRAEADPLMLKAGLFPRRAEIDAEDARARIDELAAEGCLVLYWADGVEYLELTGWERHRANGMRSSASRFPSRPGATTDPDVIPCVYFVEREPGGPVKIGFTESLWSRVSSLSTSLPGLKILGILRGADRAAEKRLHRQFAEHRDAGEWFTAAIVPWIQAHAERCPPAPSKPFERHVPDGQSGASDGQSQAPPVPDGHLLNEGRGTRDVIRGTFNTLSPPADPIEANRGSTTAPEAPAALCVLPEAGEKTTEPDHATPPPAAWAAAAAETLRAAVLRRWPRAAVPGSLTTWARELERCQAPPDGVLELVAWLTDPDRDAELYVPEVRCGKTFRAKWNQLQAAKKRSERPLAAVRTSAERAKVDGTKAAAAALLERMDRVADGGGER